LVGLISSILRNTKIDKNNIVTSQKDIRILICTPSNTAVDEIALRLKKNGCINYEGSIIF
jgi:hypothetical protein